MIFNGAPLARYWNIMRDEIRYVIPSVGFVCINLKQVVLWNSFFTGSFRKWTAESESFVANINESFQFPGGTPLTVRDSNLIVARVFLPTLVDRVDHCFVSRHVDTWCLTTGEPCSPARPACSADELTWVVKFAADLPESYREWAKRGIVMYSYVENRTKKWCIYLETVKPEDIQDHDLLQIIAWCIVRRKGHPASDPPPSSLARLLEANWKIVF